MLNMAGVKFFRSRSRFCRRGDVGSFINRSIDAEQTLRHAILEDGSAATLEEFLDLADNRAISPEAFVSLTFGVVEDEFKEWAPCLNVCSGGHSEGTRNTVMFAAAVGCKKEQRDMEATTRRDQPAVRQPHRCRRRDRHDPEPA